MSNMGERIKSLRTGKGLSIRELGGIIGRSNSNISGYETGKFEPSASTVVSLCQYFDVSADWLLTGINGQKLEQEEIPDPLPRFEVYCDGLPLSETEADLVAMYRLISSEDRKTIFDLTTLKYEQATGERGSVYSTYTDTNARQKSGYDEGDHPSHETA